VLRRVPLPEFSRASREPFLGVDRGGWQIFAAQGLSGIGTAPFVVFGPIYQRQLGATALEIGLIGALGLVVATLVMIPGTRLAEDYHLRRTILWGWLLGIPAPLLFAVVPDWRLTAVAGIFLGLAVCNTPAINVYLTLGVARDRIGFVMTIVVSAFSLGLIVSTLVSGWLAQMIGFRWLFVGAFVFFTVAAACVVGLPRKTLPPDAGIRVAYRDLLRFPSYVTLTALFSLVTVIIFIPWTFTTLYAREVLHGSDLTIGMLMAVFYLGSVSIGIALSRLRGRLGPMVVVVCFEGAFIVSAILLLSAGAIPVIALAFFLRGGFWSFRQVMTAVVGEALPGRALAKGYGLFALVTGVAAAVASPIGGWLYGMEPRLVFWTSAALMGAAIAVTLRAARAFRPLSTPVPHLVPTITTTAEEVPPKAA
jgi:MFS family permease